eukprot:5518003-Amphidinium_carterae.4
MDVQMVVAAGKSTSPDRGGVGTVSGPLLACQVKDRRRLANAIIHSKIEGGERVMYDGAGSVELLEEGRRVRVEEAIGEGGEGERGSRVQEEIRDGNHGDREIEGEEESGDSGGRQAVVVADSTKCSGTSVVWYWRSVVEVGTMPVSAGGCEGA